MLIVAVVLLSGCLYLVTNETLSIRIVEHNSDKPVKGIPVKIRHHSVGTIAISKSFDETVTDENGEARLKISKLDHALILAGNTLFRVSYDGFPNGVFKHGVYPVFGSSPTHVKRIESEEPDFPRVDIIFNCDLGEICSQVRETKSLVILKNGTK